VSPWYSSMVAHIVEGCSDTDKAEKEDSWPRRQAYIAAIANKPETILLVSAADKLHNTRAILRDYREQGDTLFRLRGQDHLGIDHRGWTADHHDVGVNQGSGTAVDTVF
jgi:hypothetical protein